MRIRPWGSLTGIVLLGTVAGIAHADASWTGPGWYVEETESGFDATLISGPYSDEDRCKASLPADTDDYSYYCENEETDPTAAQPPRPGMDLIGRD